MLITEIERDPLTALDRMERLVNDGPPTGLKFTNNVSLSCNPWLCNVVDIDELCSSRNNVRILGQEPGDITNILGDAGVFLHPDFRNQTRENEILRRGVLRGCPTSSARTIRVDTMPYYLKLHYPRILGRVDKSLTEQDIRNSIDVTELLRRALSRKDVSPMLAFFPEISGRIGKFGTADYSFTVRETRIEGNMSDCIKYIVPAFSLYGKDYEVSSDDILLKQLIKLRKGIGKNYVELLLIPIIECYLSLLFYEGLQHEMHSQNFLLGFDENWNLGSVILRDVESIQKDLTIRNARGITDTVNSYPSRCIWDGQINYKEKHSFMFDHKLYDFFIRPLVDRIEPTKQGKSIIYSKISSYVQTKYKHEIREYFPSNGKWYKFEDVIVSKYVTRRLFLECDNPMMR